MIEYVGPYRTLLRSTEADYSLGSPEIKLTSKIKKINYSWGLNELDIFTSLNFYNIGKFVITLYGAFKIC